MFVIIFLCDFGAEDISGFIRRITQMNNPSLQNNAEKDPVENGTTLSAQLAPIVFLTAIFFLNFLARIILSPLTPAIENDMGLSHGEVGSFFLFITIGYFISLAGSGIIYSRISHRLTITVSSIATGFVLVFSACIADSAWAISACVFVLGFVSGFYLPSGMATITHLVNPRHWGSAIAVHELAPNLGFVMAPLVAEVLMIWFSWRGVMAAIGFASLLTGVFFILFGRGGEFTGERPNFDSIRSLLRRQSFWVMAVLFSLGISSTVGIYSMLPLYLVADHGIFRVQANTIVAISRVSTLFIVFFAGWASDRFGAARIINIVFFLTGIMTVLIGLANTSWIILIVLLQPIFAVCFFPVGFALLSSIVPPQDRALAVSLALPVSFMIGAGFVPMGIGFMGDAGQFELAFIILGIVIFSGSILLGFVRLRDQTGKVL